MRGAGEGSAGGPRSSQNSELKFTIDKRPDPWHRGACYLEETSLTPPVAPALTLDLSISCSLFGLAKKVNSFAIKHIRPLFAKHPGWGYPLGTVQTGHIPDRLDREHP